MNTKKAGLAAGLSLAALLTLLLHTELFPYMGQWLRALSLSGGAGNAGAWAIVLLLAALPMLGLLRRRRCRWDWLLPLASLEILAGLYFLVNPTLLGTVMDLSSFWGLAAACGAGATLAAWVVLRGLERLEHASSPGRTLVALLDGAGCLLLCLAVWERAAMLVINIRSVTAGNTTIPAIWAEHLYIASDQLSLTYASLTLLAVAGLIPQLLSCLVLLWGGDLARAMEAAPFSADTVALAEKLSRRCAQTAALSVLVCVGGNAAQMLLFSSLRHISAMLSFPVETVLLAAALGVLCRYIQGAKAVNDDNESII